MAKTLQNCQQWLRPGGSLIIHTFPSRHYQFLTVNTRISHLLRPLIWLPRPLGVLYSGIFHKLVVNLFWLLRYGRTYGAELTRAAHCNPQFPPGFRKKLIRAGFKIIAYELLPESLSDQRSDRPYYAWMEKIIAKYDFYRPTIMAVVQKPS